MKKIYVGIDISKEKCNLCYREGLEIVLEEECTNDVKAIAYHINLLKEDKMLCAKMGENSLQTASSLTLSKRAKKIIMDGRPHPYQELYGNHPG